MIDRTALIQYADNLLNVDAFSDYCPNGLQVEGAAEVGVIVSGVTACQALVDEAVRLQADLLLVHHGYFWKGEAQPIVGIKRRRIATLMQHDINLLAYHLPLDAHPELGNNARLGSLLGFTAEGPMNPEGIGQVGVLEQPVTAMALAEVIAQRLDRTPQCVTAGEHRIHRVAWCTGAAQGYIEQAAALGVDAYISGEVSEQTFHQAKELGIHYFAAGHHATERYGAMALGEHLAQTFSLDHRFVDVNNPF